jgi:polyisoprenyl-phosphate glycosyltransferase
MTAMIEQRKILISIVSPVYQSEKIVDELTSRIISSVSSITQDFEIIFIEDGSRDNSWEKIEENCRKDRRIKGLKLSRNFGQHNAITAGLEASRGEYVVVMDCDLQDNPKYILPLYEKIKQGFDIVYTHKRERKHSFLKNFSARLFFKVFNYLSENVHAKENMGSYSILSRKAVDAFCRIKDAHRHYLMVVNWIGFSSAYIEIDHEHRFEGRSSYTFMKLLRHAVNGITSQSVKLLYLAIGTGFLFFILSITWAAVIIVRYFLYGALAGYTSTMALILLATGLILMSIGIVGIYIGKIFEQVKERPLYFVEKKANL